MPLIAVRPNPASRSPARPPPPGGAPPPPAAPPRPPRHVRLDPAVALLGVLERRLREDDRELVPADPAGDVGRADDVADPVGGPRQHGAAPRAAEPGAA